MRLHSLRWRLPLSYAGVALLATLALGAILLVTLGAYYQGRERDYLRANAAAVGAELGPLLAAGAPPDELRARAQAYAFLLQSRVQVEDAARGLTVDSGPPTMLGIEIDALPSSQAGEGVESAAQILVRTTDMSAAAPLPEPPPPPAPPAPGDDPAAAEEQARRQAAAQAPPPGALPIARTIYGFNLGPEAAREARRSALVESAPITHPGDGRPLGGVRFSEGPAYGREIILRVAWSLAFAGLLATALGAAAGWQASRGVIGPLSALTDATGRMAAGDLGARVGLRRRDELGQLAHAFDAMAGRVDGTVQALRRFVADAAHELNTPLTALRANLDLARETGQRDELRRYVERASADAERLEQLARGLLQLSRLEADPADLPVAPLDLAALVRELSESYGAWAEQGEIEFHVEAPARPVIIVGRAPQVRQAIGNIVANAVKFTPAGGRVMVRVAHGPQWAAVSVEDSGIGIAADELPRLFDRFHRGRNAGAYPGSGLGLAIVRTIMASHGGEVTAESDRGGTRFTLRWPALSGGYSTPRND